MTDEKTDALNLQKTEWITAKGEVVCLVYDEAEDILEAFFGDNEPATGIELTDHILLRLNQTTGRVVSLTLLHFSILAERTEFGPRSYPLDNLKGLPETLRELVIRALTTSPVDEFLKLSYFQASPTKRVPFTYVEPSRLAVAA
ncbi:MAG: hypothetical protein Fur0044_54320 [Anaerolineae bacterium]